MEPGLLKNGILSETPWPLNITHVHAQKGRMMKILLGPPGTGKTSRILREIEAALSSGSPAHKIGFISFTRMAVAEGVNRAVARFGISKREFTWFRTVHSLAFHLMGLTRSQIIQKQQLEHFGSIIGVPITGNFRTDQMTWELEKGDQALFLHSLARNTCRTLSDVWADGTTDLSWEETEFIAKSYEVYKQENYLLDFTDILVQVNMEAFPSLDYLFIDEAQDLSRLQWRVLEGLIEGAKTTLIAGDDDQAIFRWSGADVDRMISLSQGDNVEVLSQSYRIPRSVHAFSQRIIHEIAERREKTYAPRDEEGKVDWLNDIDSVDLDKGNWLILVRNSYQIKEIVEHCRREGFSYETQYESSKDLVSIKKAVDWEKCRKSGEAHWYEADIGIPEEDREYMLAARRRGENLAVGKSRLRISTIHGAKGSECDNVLLFTDISFRTYRYMQENPDDETRVFYVGATRAKQRLVIMQPQGKYYFNV